MSLKPICVNCHCFYRPKKNGFNFTEGMPKAWGVLPGELTPEGWTPYKLWSGDLWECPLCNNQLITTGAVQQPIMVQHEQGFELERKRLKADQFQVNDC